MRYRLVPVFPFVAALLLLAAVLPFSRYVAFAGENSLEEEQPGGEDGENAEPNDGRRELPPQPNTIITLDDGTEYKGRFVQDDMNGKRVTIAVNDQYLYIPRPRIKTFRYLKEEAKKVEIAHIRKKDGSTVSGVFKKEIEDRWITIEIDGNDFDVDYDEVEEVTREVIELKPEYQVVRIYRRDGLIVDGELLEQDLQRIKVRFDGVEYTCHKLKTRKINAVQPEQMIVIYLDNGTVSQCVFVGYDKENLAWIVKIDGQNTSILEEKVEKYHEVNLDMYYDFVPKEGEPFTAEVYFANDEEVIVMRGGEKVRYARTDLKEMNLYRDPILNELRLTLKNGDIIEGNFAGEDESEISVKKEGYTRAFLRKEIKTIQTLGKD